MSINMQLRQLGIYRIIIKTLTVIIDDDHFSAVVCDSEKMLAVKTSRPSIRVSSVIRTSSVVLGTEGPSTTFTSIGVKSASVTVVTIYGIARNRGLHTPPLYAPKQLTKMQMVTTVEVFTHERSSYDMHM